MANTHPPQATHSGVAVDDRALRARVADVLDRWPTVGLAAAVVRNGTLVWFHGHGQADITSRTPVTQDTAFRIGSITKTFTAIAIMQLWEDGLVDLDAPANDYLRTFRLVPGSPDLAPATVRHLLTHTAGIGYWRRLSDVLRPGIGSGDVPMEPRPRLADYYRGGLLVEVEPGTKWVYSNHGFAALGQIVEDVSGQPYDQYLRAHVLGPLQMDRSGLVRTEEIRRHLATGYVLRRHGPRPVPHGGELPLSAAGGLYATTADLARYAGALLDNDVGAHERILRRETLASMFRPNLQTDPRVRGMGLAFWLGDEDGHPTVGHSGTVSGFLSHVLVAPDDDVAVIVLANTGGLTGSGAPEPLATALLREVIGLPEETARPTLPPHPEVWNELCGWYGMPPGPLTNLFNRLVFGAGVEVVVVDRELRLRPLSPIPTMRKGFRLIPDDDTDPYAFRVDFSDVGLGPMRIAFSPPDGRGASGRQIEGLGMSLHRRPGALNPRLWARGAITAGVPLALDRYRRRDSS